MPEARRWIAHVDMDAFFVSVELRRRPELRGQPVVVATGTDPTARGVVMAASYEARKFGVHSALPLAVAHRRCPQMVLLPRNFEAYRQTSVAVMEVLRSFSDRVEVAGLDEAYLDLSGSPVPEARGRQIKVDIRRATGLVASVGLAPNKLLAKIASDLDKPDGFRVLRPEQMLTAVGQRPASIIPGVGPKTAERLAGLGISTVADLAGADPALLERTFGPSLGRLIHTRANGFDRRPVETDRVRKSESRETTFAEDVEDRDVLRGTVARLAEQVGASLRAHQRAGKTVTLKIRLRPFSTHTRSRTIAEPTNDPDRVRRIALELLDTFELERPVRLVGVGVASLAGNGEETPVEETATSPQTALALED